jgi:hypothetical protein
VTRLGTTLILLANGFPIPAWTLTWNLGTILRIAAKVRTNVLLVGPPPVLVRLAPAAPRRMLVRVLALLGMILLMILLVMTLRWRKRLPLLLLVLELFSCSFLLLVE